MNYNQYLQSDHWQSVRAGALARAGNRCENCGLKPMKLWLLHIHHLTYMRKGCERPDDVIVLCPGCHDAAHSGQTVDRNYGPSHTGIYVVLGIVIMFTSCAIYTGIQP